MKPQARKQYAKQTGKHQQKGAIPMNAVDIAKQKSESMKRHAKDVICLMASNGEKINFFTVSQRAGVSRGFLYQHKELNSMIQLLRLSKMTKQELQAEVLRNRLQSIKHKNNFKRGNE